MFFNLLPHTSSFLIFFFAFFYQETLYDAVNMAWHQELFWQRSIPLFSLKSHGLCGHEQQYNTDRQTMVVEIVQR